MVEIEKICKVIVGSNERIKYFRLSFLYITILTDSRGEFRTWFAVQNIGTDLSNFTVMQSNISKSVKSVIRGVHFSDATYEQTKIITCVSGSIKDYAIDLRTQSKTFGMYDSVELSENNGRTAVLKHGLGHAFEVLSETVTIVYFFRSGIQVKSPRSILLTQNLLFPG